MSTDHELRRDCQEWRRLAEAEGEAIRTRNWTLVMDCQKALERLQPRLSDHIQLARAEWKRLGPEGAGKERDFQALINELIEMESQNKARLSSQQQETRGTIHQLEQASRTLRRVQSSYAQARPVAWTSLS
jgi:DNA repair exonuclease SbcCD ATPase subunit